MKIVEITPEMITEAQRIAELRKEKYGAKTRPVSDDRDYIGDLAEQACEMLVKNWNLAYYATRLDRYNVGDQYDLKISFREKNVLFDVKGSKSYYNPKLNDENEIYIFDQLEKLKKVHYLLFCRIDEYQHKCLILGAVSLQKFIDNAREGRIGRYKIFKAKSKILTDLKDVIKYYQNEEHY